MTAETHNYSYMIGEDLLALRNSKRSFWEPTISPNPSKTAIKLKFS